MIDPIFYRTPVTRWRLRPSSSAYVVHQTRLQGGDASSDSYCFTS